MPAAAAQEQVAAAHPRDPAGRSRLRPHRDGSALPPTALQLRDPHQVRRVGAVWWERRTKGSRFHRVKGARFYFGVYFPSLLRVSVSLVFFARFPRYFGMVYF